MIRAGAQQNDTHSPVTQRVILNSENGIRAQSSRDMKQHHTERSSGVCIPVSIGQKNESEFCCYCFRDPKSLPARIPM